MVGDQAARTPQVDGYASRRRSARAERRFLGTPIQCAWRELSERYGPRTTCYNRFVRWQKAAVWGWLIDAISTARDETNKPCFSKGLYRERNLIERLFVKLKHYRRIANRYDKLADNFLAMVQLAPMRLWLRAYESTA